jgi:hypothetical protein
MLGGKRLDRSLVDEARQQLVEVIGDRRVGRFGILLPDLGEPSLHRLRHVAVADLLVADRGERRAATAAAQRAAADIGQIAQREGGDDGQHEQRHDDGTDRRFRQAANGSKHCGFRLRKCRPPL